MAEAVRTIAVVTGTRAEYGLLRPVMRAIAATPGLRLQVVVAGMHLAREFGRTGELVAADGFRIDARVDMLLAGDDGAAMARGIGTGLVQFVDAFELLVPDVVLVLGDRVEPFAAAVGACFGGRAVAHVHGGDTAGGGFDEPMRAAITRFAHLHFPATERSRDRIVRSGERPEHVWQVGAPGLDEILAGPPPDPAEAARAAGLDPARPWLLVVQHPVSTRGAGAPAELRETLAAVGASGLQAVVTYPNADAGGRAAIDVLHAAAGTPGLVIVDNLPRERYLGLLAGAAALVGNSSSGIIEAPSFRVPVVNVGDRQEGRERADNVLDVPHRRDAILAGIERALGDPSFRRRVAACVNPYGDGKAAARIAGHLAAARLGPELLQKRFTW